MVTNYRDFVLLGRDASGKRVELETYRLAASETAFWAVTTDPYALAEVQGGRFIEFLKRVMLYAAPLINPADVAWFLASYARDARARIEDIDLPALTAVRTALEEVLGVTFEGRKGDHFFRSTLVQTLFYGIFSAWVLWSKKRAPGKRIGKASAVFAPPSPPSAPAGGRPALAALVASPARSGGLP